MAKLTLKLPFKTSSKESKITMQGLRKYNLSAMALHLIQAILVLVLADSAKGVQPITTSYLTTDTLASQAANAPVLVQGTTRLFDINLAYLVAAFFFMSFLAHLIIAFWYRKRYEADLNDGINRARWVEYAISASTMMLAISLLSGIFDLSSLIMIFVLTALMNIMGLAMELQNRGVKKPNWFSFWVGILAGIVPWIVFLIYVWGASVYGDGNIPTFVYWIYGSIFLFFNCFAVNMWLQYKKIGKWSNYLYGERTYIILSLVAKSALAWQVFAGTLRP